VQREKGLARLHGLAGGDVHLRHDATQGRAHRDVLGAGLDDPDRGHGLREVADRRPRRRVGPPAARVCAGHWDRRAQPGERGPRRGEGPEGRQGESLHESASAEGRAGTRAPGCAEPLARVTSTMRPSSMRAMLWAYLKTRLSWVTTMTARSGWTAVLDSSSITASPFAWSRA